MNPEERAHLEKLFGTGLTDEELEKIASSYPNLTRESEWLDRNLNVLREGEPPPLGESFTRSVMANLDRRPAWIENLERWLSWRTAFVTGSLAVATLAAFLLIPRFIGPGKPGSELPGELATGPTQPVHFTVRLPQAKTVAVAGDFNQWNLQPLKPSPDGVYAVELSLPQGNYAYSFVVDGKQWIPDPSAEKKIEDGFGGFNSLLNL